MQNQILKVKIVQSNALLSEQCIWAKDSRSRMIGLLNHHELKLHESLLLDPCFNVHTFFMKFPIDVVFLDKRNFVLKICSLQPWRVSPFVWSAKKVLELPLGRCQALNLSEGNQLEFNDA